MGQELKILMAMFPDVGTHLWAMSREAFLPRSRHYEGDNWKTRKVDEFETRRLVQAALRDTKAEFGVENECRFFRVFGYLTVLGETWGQLDLDWLQNSSELVRGLKHEMTAHWVQLAAQLATKPIPLQPGPVALLKKNDEGDVWGFAVAGNTSPFGNDLTVRLSGGELTEWESFCKIILSLEFDKQVLSKARAFKEPDKVRSAAANALGKMGPTAVEALPRLVKALEAEEAEPEKYKELTPSEISRLCQVQLQLSCGCGIVEVEGAIDPADVGILATLLGHQLTHLQLIELNDFEVESKKVAESLKASREILILLVTKTGRLHQLVKKQCLNLQRRFPRQLRIILSFA